MNINFNSSFPQFYPVQKKERKYQTAFGSETQKNEFETIFSKEKRSFKNFLKNAIEGYHKKSETNLPYSLLQSKENRTYVLLKSRSRKRNLLKFDAVGRGSFCKVTLCYDIKFKKYNICRSMETLNEGFFLTKNEIEINNKLKEHPNYFASGEVFEYESSTRANKKRNKTTFIMEYFEEGDLAKAVIEGKITKLPKEKTLQIINHIVEGLNILHTELGYRWNDLKLENILLNQNFEPRLSDFGLACAIDEDNINCAGTLPYIPPEKKNSEKSDIWALGVLLIEMKDHGIASWYGNTKTKEEFYDTISTPENLLQKLKSILLNESHQNPKHIDSIIYKCLSFNPENRPTTKELLMLLKNVEIC